MTASPFAELWSPLEINDSFSEDLVRQFDLKRYIPDDVNDEDDQRGKDGPSADDCSSVANHEQPCQDEEASAAEHNDAEEKPSAPREVAKHPFLDTLPPPIVVVSTADKGTLNRNLLRKSSAFFRQRIKKMKAKESPVSSTITADSSVDPVVLHYPPKPLHYSTQVHPPAEQDAKRRSLPLPAKYRHSLRRPRSIHDAEKRKSFILRSLLKS